MTSSSSDRESQDQQQTARVVLWDNEWPLLRRFSNCVVKYVGEMNQTVDQQREKTAHTLEETRDTFTKKTIDATQQTRTFMKQNPIIAMTSVGSLAAIVASIRGRPPISMARFAVTAMILTSAFLYPDHLARFAVSPSDYWTEEVKPYFLEQEGFTSGANDDSKQQ